MLVVVGTNHKYSPLHIREKISFSQKRLKEALLFLKGRDILREAVILSTCNRVEIYARTEDSTRGMEEIEDFISGYHGIDEGAISPYLYGYEGREALRHLFSVSSGLDSLILGETQILGQVKFSFSQAESVGFADGFLRGVFYSAVSIARQIHAETKISEGKVSVGSVAIDFVKEKTGALSSKNILIIGVGKVTELVLKYLKKETPQVVFISNRTFEKAKELASQIGAKVVRFDDLRKFLKKADIVITATASPHFVIKKETLEEAISPLRRIGLRGREPSAIGHKLLLLDLALPRDIEPRVKELDYVDLFGLEDLETVIKKNMERKIQEAEKAKKIIDIEVERLWGELTELEPEPALSL